MTRVNTSAREPGAHCTNSPGRLDSVGLTFLSPKLLFSILDKVTIPGVKGLLIPATIVNNTIYLD